VIPDGTFLRVVTSGYGLCAIDVQGALTCANNTALEKTPPGRFTDVYVTINDACGVREDGIVVCWRNGRFQSPPGTFASVANNDVGLGKDGTVRYWGNSCNGGTICSNNGDNTLARCVIDPESITRAGHWDDDLACQTAACRARLVCPGACVAGACVGTCVPGSAGACVGGAESRCNERGEMEMQACADGCIDGFGCKQPACGRVGGACCSGARAECEPGGVCQSTCQQTTCDITGSCRCEVAGTSRCVASPLGAACTQDDENPGMFDLTDDVVLTKAKTASCGTGAARCLSIDGQATPPYCSITCASDRDCGVGLRCIVGCGLLSGTCLKPAHFDYVWGLCVMPR
jgi:hypothetical protein